MTPVRKGRVLPSSDVRTARLSVDGGFSAGDMAFGLLGALVFMFLVIGNRSSASGGPPMEYAAVVLSEPASSLPGGVADALAHSGWRLEKIGPPNREGRGFLLSRELSARPRTTQGVGELDYLTGIRWDRSGRPLVQRGVARDVVEWICVGGGGK
jgi:hypothetical protein